MAAGCTYLLVEVQGSPGRSGLADRRAPSPAARAAVDEALLAAGGTIVGEQLTGGDVPRRVVSALYTLGRDAVRAALTLPGLATKDGGAPNRAARGVIPLAPYAVEHLTRAIVNARCPSPPATRQRVPQHQWLVEVGSP